MSSGWQRRVLVAREQAAGRRGPGVWPGPLLRFPGALRRGTSRRAPLPRGAQAPAEPFPGELSQNHI